MTAMTQLVTPVPALSSLDLRIGVISGAAGMAFVGGSIAVSDLLTTAPFLTAQALRYAVACALLLALARATGRPIERPRPAEWPWLAAIAATGLVLFNFALVRGAAHAEPAVFGVAVASVPVLLAGVGPVLERRRPAARIVVAACVVTAGAALVQGTGSADAAGIGWAVVVLGSEAAFTLLALPVLPRLGAWGVSVYSTGIAFVMLGVVGLAVDGPGAALTITRTELLAAGYLALIVTALAFVLWYTTVTTLGAGRAGLLTGVAPVTAAVGGVLLGRPAPDPLVWLGIAVVTCGLALGLAPGRHSVAAAAVTGGAQPGVPADLTDSVSTNS